MNRDRKIHLYSYTAAFALIISMVSCSVIFHNHEFILPEIAAMAIAMWAYRDPNWLRDPLKICLAPSMTSVIGFTINQLNLAHLEKVGITLVLIMLCLRLIQSNFAPSLATGLLPLITDSHDGSLILLIFAATFVLMLVVILFGMHSSLNKKVNMSYKNTIFFLGLTFLWFGICWITGFEKLAVIPPILVVVYESLQKADYSGTIALKQGLALTISSTIGTLLFLSIESLIVITLLDMSLMLILQKMMKIRMPAIYAFPLFPFILPKEMVLNLPLGTFVTCIFMFAIVTVYKQYNALAKSKSTDVSM
ncbi:hypothetical protein [Paenibacillus sp. RC67]|uniref:hypothetical protein n=1 Tax=Paenibacillus sp. RC67 TaxID=3039392 RepID=UPI0024AD14F9|nr:hypothetical protein [Paenibacillus sp. RC67]